MVTAKTRKDKWPAHLFHVPRHPGKSPSRRQRVVQAQALSTRIRGVKISLPDPLPPRDRKEDE